MTVKRPNRLWTVALCLWICAGGFSGRSEEQKTSPATKTEEKTAAGAEPKVEKKDEKQADKKPAGEPAKPKRLGEVTVAATKTEREADTTPGEVNIIERKDLDIQQAGKLEDILKYEPGTEAKDGPRRIAERPNIRGLDGPRVLVTTDGARMNFDSGHKGQMFVEPDYLKRVEVVRGPSSALYGSSALGGVLAMTTISPDDYLGENDVVGMKVKGGFKGADREWMWQPTVYGRFGKEGAGKKAEYLMSYTGRDAGEMRIGNGNSSLADSAERIASGLGKVVAKPTKQDIASFSAMIFNDKQKVPANTSSDTSAETPATSTLVDRNTRQSNYTLKYDHTDPGEKLNFSLTAYHTQMEMTEDRVFQAGQHDENGYGTWGVDARHSMTFRPGPAVIRVTTGFEFYRDSQDSGTTRTQATAALFFPQATADHIAPYIQGEFSFYDDLFVLIPGVRYTSYSMKATSGKTDTKDWSPKVGALIKLDDEIGLEKGDHLIMEGSYGQGFRAPTFGELFIGGPHFRVVDPIAPGFNFVTIGTFFPTPSLKPETGKSWELGSRFKWHGLRAQFTYFENDLKDFIDFVVTARGPRFSFPPPQLTLNLDFKAQNLATASIRGFEAEASYEFLDHWRVWGNWTKNRGDSIITQPDGALMANPLTSISPDRVAAGFDYYHEKLGLTAGVRARIVRKKDRVPISIDDDHPSGADALRRSLGYTVWDFAASWRPESSLYPKWLHGVQVDAGIDNLTNKYYVPYFQSVPGAGFNPKVSISYTRNW